VVDVPSPPQITTRKLAHLAAEHGFLNPFAHRAVFDVLTMLKILSCYPIENVIISSNQPLMKLVALVAFDGRYKAKARGFSSEFSDQTNRLGLSKPILPIREVAWMPISGPCFVGDSGGADTPGSIG